MKVIRAVILIVVILGLTYLVSHISKLNDNLERRMRMDAKELRHFLEKVMMTISNEIDNIADDKLRDKLEQLVLNVEDTRNYIRFNFERE